MSYLCGPCSSVGAFEACVRQVKDRAEGDILTAMPVLLFQPTLRTGSENIIRHVSDNSGHQAE